MAVQTDGKVLLGGSFTSLAGQVRNRIGRLNIDGSFDGSFNPDANGTVYTLAVQSDGKVLVGGSFTSIGGQVRNRIARLNSDGSLDTSFNPGANNIVHTLAPQSDGKILVGGMFTTLGGQTRNRIARLNSDGSLDTSFNPGANGTVYALSVQPNGNVLVGGEFTVLGGQNRNYLARVNANGSIDTGFNPGPDSFVYCFAFQSDGRILVGGEFTSLGGETLIRLARLNIDGSVDASFTPWANGSVSSMVVQSDGKILVGGGFYVIGLESRNHLARLNPDGSIDPTFDPAPNNSTVSALALQTDGRVIVGGDFSSIGGQTRNWVARLANEPAVSTLAVAGTTQINWARGGSAPEVEQVSFEYWNGTGWVPAGAAASRVTGVWRATGLSLPASSWVRARGRSAGGPNNGSSTMIEQVSAYGADAFPELEVRLNGGSPVGNGLGRLDFGAVKWLESAPEQTVTLTNTGSGALSGLSFELLGPASGDFDVSSPGTTTLAPGASVSFTVSFTPSEGGRWSVPFRISSNDLDTSPFEIQLLGRGLRNDGGFNPSADNTVNSFALQPNGKVVVGGQFTNLGGQSRNYLARLNADGSLDASFTSGTDHYVNALAVQADGKILVGGDFVTLGGQLRTRIGRLNIDGSVDTTFAPPDVYNSVIAMAVQADGRILVGGAFGQIGDQTRNRIARLNVDGSLDTSFNPNVNDTVNTLTLLSDGKVLLGGNFTIVGGQIRNRIARLNEDGSLDTSFNPGANNTVNAMVLQSDGKVVIGGAFSSLGGQVRNRIARLNADGSLDSSFNPGVNGTVNSLALQSDGKVIVGGNFTALGGQTRFRIARLNADGSLDASFNPGANGIVGSLALQSDGKLLVGGSFSTLGGEVRSRIGLLLNDSATSQLSVTGTGQIDWQRGGSAPEVDRVLFDYWDGAGWTPVASAASRVPGGWRVTGLSLPSSSWLRARGRTIGGFNNGSSGFVEQASAYGGNAFPDLEVRLNGGDPVGNGVGRLDFGSVVWKGSVAAQTVTVTNAGTVPLTGLSVELFGPAAGDFEVGSFGTTNLAPGTSTSLDVTFSPAEGGDRSVSLRISSNDIGASPFEIQLLARGLRNESTFNPGANATVYALAVQNDGKVLAGGNFTTFGGQSRQRLARLNPDGSLDHLFNPQADNNVDCIVVLSDGKILVAGDFTTIGGQNRNYLARLNADGSLDASFNGEANGVVRSMIVQSDGKVVIGGYFTSFGGQSRNRIARINADGSLDSFNPGADGPVFTLALQTDGKVLAGGAFLTVGGLPRDNLARLNTDGSIDTSFNPGANGQVDLLAMQADGKLIAAGEFTALGGQARNGIARLNGDGSLDGSFNPGAGGAVYSLALQSDGKVLVGGVFSSIGGQSRKNLARLNPDGSADFSFNPGASGPVVSLAQQSDGKVLAGGSFTALGGETRNRISRLLNDGASSQLTVTGTSRIDWVRGGSAPELEQVSFEHWNGAGWSLAGMASRVAGNWRTTGLTLPARAWIRAKGRTTGGYRSGSSGLIEQLVPFGLGADPGLSLTRDASPLVPGEDEIDFGPVLLETTGDPVTVTVRNDGPVGLTGLVVATSGGNAGDFPVGNLSASTLAPGASATFELAFSPDAAGLRETTLEIRSDATHWDPSVIVLKGTGVSAELRDLVTGTGTLAPAFRSDIDLYTVSVGNTAETIVLTPTAVHGGATISVKGDSVASGSPSSPIPLSIGPNPIPIIVTAQGGLVQKTYTVIVTRDKAAQTVNFVNPGPQLANATVILSATGGGSGNALTFSATGPAQLGSGNVLTFTGPGSVTVKVNQAGNESYHPAPEVSQTFEVTAASATVILNQLNHVYDGTPKSVTVTTVPPGLSVQINFGGPVPINAGDYPVTVTVTDPRYVGNAMGSLMIAKAPQVITFANPGDQPVNATVTLTANGGASGNTVTYAVTNGPATITGGNQLSFGGTGEVTVTASQTGSGNYEAAPTVARTFMVTKATATLTLSRLHQVADGTAREVVVTTNPADLDVEVTYDGDPDAPTAPGTYAVVASSTDSRYEGTTSGTLVVEDPAAMTRIPGGQLTALSDLGALDVSDFEIGRHEVTRSLWNTVRDWAAAHGYDLAAIGTGSAGDHPVHSLNWYDALKWCNARTEWENATHGRFLAPVYRVGANVYRSGEPDPATILVDDGTSGYRLPTAREWEFAARGGASATGKTYAGGNDPDLVAWHAGNSGGAIVALSAGRGTWPAGQKAANELGLYDFSGNLAEWTQTANPANPSTRFLRGGSWNGTAGESALGVLGSAAPAGRLNTSGLRVARSVAAALAGSVDSTSLTWRSGGDAPWFAQNGTTHDGADAAESGHLSQGQSSWLETSVSGPGNLRFRWKTAGTEGQDVLAFAIDSISAQSRSGTGDWEERLVEIGSGTHTLRWSYARGSTSGEARAWLDTVSFETAGPPTVTTTAPTGLTTTDTTLGGEVTNDGRRAVTARGVVYATSAAPTLAGATELPATAGGVGSFTVSAVGLSEGATYHARAYATNNLGTSYGPEVVFTTDTNVTFSGGVATFTRSLLPGGRQVFRFSLAGLRVVSLATLGGAALRAELYDGEGNLISSFTGDADFDLEELLLAGDYELHVFRLEGGGPAQTFDLTIDASVVAASRPDVAVGSSAAVLIGAGVYLPSGQSVSLTSRLARPVTGYASIGNRGNLPDVMTARAPGGNAFFRVAYFGPGGNITTDLIAGTYRTPELERGNAAVPIRVSVTPDTKKLTRKTGRRVTILKKTHILTITAASTFDPSIQDAGTIRVRTN